VWFNPKDRRHFTGGSDAPHRAGHQMRARHLVHKWLAAALVEQPSAVFEAEIMLPPESISVACVLGFSVLATLAWFVLLSAGDETWSSSRQTARI
jgi:hypothetical protein